MSPDRHEEGPDAMPPEFEHFMRPGPTASPLGNGETPRHDKVSETALSDFADLFRDAPATPAKSAGPRPPAAPPPTAPPMPPLESAGTQVLPPPSGAPRRGATQPPAPPRGGRSAASAEAGATQVLPPAAGRAHPVQMTAPPVRTTPPPAPPKTAKPGRAKRILILVLVAVLTYITALVVYFALNVNKINAMPVDQIGDTAGSNYLLVGSDGRQDLTKKQQRILHTGDTQGQRTDTIMLLHVPNFGTPTLISIPRDSWVPIPGHGSNKINAAFAEGGAPLLIQTVENTTGVHIDHYVEIGMLGVADVADSLGGLTLCPQSNYNDQNSGLHVKKGCQAMDGPTSLAYVRMRYSDPKGDIGRAERQQEYVKAVVAKTANPLSFLNPFKMFSADKAAASALTVDDGTGIVADARMGIAMGMLSAGMGQSTTVPIETDSYWVGGQQAVKWDTSKALALFKEIGGA